MACALAKMDSPGKDITKPYVEIEGTDTYSGRNYDEKFIEPYVISRKLPCNSTTAFLTPALRNIRERFSRETVIAGKPKELYTEAINILNDVQEGRYTADHLLAQIIKNLYEMKEQDTRRQQDLLDSLESVRSDYPMSVDKIINLVFKHMSLRNTSRLPVLVVTAAYNVASSNLNMVTRPLESHNAADLQTRSLGDIEITLTSDDVVIATYEIKDREVTREDIAKAVTKIASSSVGLENYYFVTTKPCNPDVVNYALSFYDQLNGIEICIMDCYHFLKHFLYLIPRVRTRFLEEYQRLLLDEPTSAVSQSLKGAFIALRTVAEEQNGGD
ncbi:MAG: restriction endonuclease, SacI family [Methanomassiliicoccales archaeon]